MHIFTLKANTTTHSTISRKKATKPICCVEYEAGRNCASEPGHRRSQRPEQVVDDILLALRACNHPQNALAKERDARDFSQRLQNYDDLGMGSIDGTLAILPSRSSARTVWAPGRGDRRLWRGDRGEAGFLRPANRIAYLLASQERFAEAEPYFQKRAARGPRQRGGPFQPRLHARQAQPPCARPLLRSAKRRACGLAWTAPGTASASRMPRSGSTQKRRPRSRRLQNCSP